VLKTYGAAPYAAALKKLEKQIKEKQTSVNEKIGVKAMLSVHRSADIG
jgi:26S proteasome regulatory subunit T1